MRLHLGETLIQQTSMADDRPHRRMATRPSVVSIPRLNIDKESLASPFNRYANTYYIVLGHYV